MLALNIFLTIILYLFAGWVVWLIANSILTFLEAGPKVRQAVKILGYVTILIFLVLFIAGRIEYFRFIK